MFNFLFGSKEKEESVKETTSETTTENVEISILDKARKIPEIDVEAGIQASTDEDIFLVALEEFKNSITESFDSLEEAFAKQDIENYTIYVHGLKSAARLVGANDIADRSFELEKAGKANAWNLIAEKHEQLLTDAKELHKKISDIF